MPASNGRREIAVALTIAAVAATLTFAACGGATDSGPTSTPVQPPVPTPTPTPTPTPPSNPKASYTLVLAPPASSPAAGSQATVWLVAKRDTGSATVGSFSAVVAMDTSMLAYAGQVNRTTDGIVAMNSGTPSSVQMAGAATSFSNDTLAGMLFTVKKTGGLTGATLIIRELTTSKFEDKTAVATSGPAPNIAASLSKRVAPTKVGARRNPR